MKQLADTLRDHINDEPIAKYWKSKFQLSESTWQMILIGMELAEHTTSPALRSDGGRPNTPPVFLRMEKI